MLDKETFNLAELLGHDDPKVQALTWMARDPQNAEDVRQLLRGLCRDRGIDPDDLPAFGMPKGLSPSECPIGRAKCGNVLGEAVGPSAADFKGHIGVFAATGQGKSTLVKMILETFCRDNSDGA